MSPSISIRLTEPVVFLRDSLGTSEGRHHGAENHSPPSFVRGLVTLTLTKPTRVSSIEVALEGKSSTVWPDGPSSVGTRRGESSSEKTFLTEQATLYSARSCPSSKRSASLGPLQADDDYLPRSHPHPSLRSLSTQPRVPRRNSSEYTSYPDPPTQENVTSVPLDSVASPPLSPFYTPPYTPQYTTMELPISSRPETPIEYADNSSNRMSMNIQENHRSSREPFQVSTDDSAVASMNLLNLSPTRYYMSGSSSRITLTMPSPPISRSVSRDPTHNHNRTASPSPNPSTPRVRGRHSSKWSLSNMTHILKDATDRIRSVSKEQDLHRGRNPEPRRHGHSLDYEHSLEEGISNCNQIDDARRLDSWKEFRKGTYTYPISFVLSANCPPTISCDYGSVSYTLRAVVHRPGALTPKFACSRDVVVVASSAEDDTEATHSIAIERQWDTQLRYIISLGGRNFVIGGTIPFSLTLVPLDKCKVFRLSVFLEEKISHRGLKEQNPKELPVRRFELLSIKHPYKVNIPILPVEPEQAEILKPYVETTSLAPSQDEAFASLMGPGPWVLSHTLRVDADCTDIHFSFKHTSVNMIISHTLKIVFRVERGDTHAMDPGTGKRRQFDIVVQMPIRILSSYSNVELTSLPRYTFFAPDNNTSPSSERTSVQSPQQMSTLLHARHTHNSNTFEQFSVDFLNNAIQFSRLVSGQENTSGDAPPEYQEATSEE